MTVTCYFECPKCHAKNAVEYDIGEHFAEIPDECDECNYKFSKREQEAIYADLDENAVGTAIDMADMYKDRYYDR